MTPLDLFVTGLFCLFAGLLKAIRDSIVHRDYFKKWGYWFSKEASEKAKYVFIVKHPIFNNKIGKLFVLNFLVMFLDAWHFSEMLLVLGYGVIASIFSGAYWMIPAVWGSISLFFLIGYGLFKEKE